MGKVVMQKYNSYISNLTILSTAKEQDLMNEFIISGIIAKYSIQFTFTWKLLKELLQYEGIQIADSATPREIIKAAYAIYDFIEEEAWLSMLRARNNMTHIYDGTAAKELVNIILQQYIPAFVVLKEGIEERYGRILQEL